MVHLRPSINHKLNSKIFEFDMIRSLAILIILFHHLPGYCFNFYDLNFFGISADLSELNNLNRYFGLGLFTFLLGYFVDLKGIDLSDRTILSGWLKKKILRIFPLYYLALIMYVLMLKKFDPLSIIFHVFGLQLITASNIFEPLPVLWFIGLVVVYYFQFVSLRTVNLLDARCETSKYKTLRLFITAFVVILPLFIIAINRLFQAVDLRIILYYGCFWFGILCARGKVIESFNKIIVLILFPGAIALYLLFHAQTNISLNDFALGYFTLDDLVDFIRKFTIANILMIGFILFICKFSKIFSSTIERNSLAANFVSVISYSSYCMFLLHQPIWFLMSFVNRQLGVFEDEKFFAMILIVIGIPLIVGISKIIQSNYDRFCQSQFARGT
jgi:Acyltransferase family